MTRDIRDDPGSSSLLKWLFALSCGYNFKTTRNTGGFYRHIRTTMNVSAPENNPKALPYEAGATIAVANKDCTRVL